MSGPASSVFTAASHDENDVVEDYLLSLGNDPNETDDLGLTGLHRCATKGAVAAAHTYLVHGANFNTPDRESGWSVLHRAVYFQYIKLSMLLIAFGAQMEDSGSKGRVASKPDNDGFTPMALLSRVLSPHLVSGGHTTANTLYCYGKSDFTLGIPLPNAPNVAHAKRIETLLDKHITQVCASKHHSLAVTADGELFAWGYGRWGRLGLGSEVDQPEPRLISSLLGAKVRIRQVASGENHTIAVTMAGDVYTWGSDRCGQLGHGNALLRAHAGPSNSHDKDASSKDIMLLEPRRVDALRRVFVLQVAAGDAHSLCLAKHDELYAWGSNKSGQLGLKATELSHLPGGADGTNTPKLVLVDHSGRVRTSAVSKQVGSVRGRPRNEVILQVAASHNNSLLLCRTVHLETAQGGLVRGSVGTEVFQWGHGIFEPVKVLFTTRQSKSGTKVKVSLASEYTAVGKTRFVNITQVAAGQHHFAGISADGCVYTWQIAAEEAAQEQAAIGPERKEERVDGRVAARGSLSGPKLLEAMLPERGGGQVTHIAASSSRMSATTSDGDLFAWDLTLKNGSNLYDPRRVPGVKRAVAVSVGAEHTLLLSAVSQPPLPLYDCELYRLQMRDESFARYTQTVRDERGEHQARAADDEDSSVGSGGCDELLTGAFSGTTASAVMEEADSEEQSGGDGDIIGNESIPLGFDSDDTDQGEEEKIPSLFAICQRQVAQSVNIKTVLTALNFADNFDAQLLSAYCTAYIQMNFDLILVQSKHVEIEKFVEGMGFSLQVRAGVKEYASSAAATGPVRPGKQPRSGSLGEAPGRTDKVAAAPIEAKTHPSTSEEVRKQMRSARKKLTAIQELQDKQREDNSFVLSSEQSEKVQKREQLHREMAHLEQLLVRCEVRERNNEKKSVDAENATTGVAAAAAVAVSVESASNVAPAKEAPSPSSAVPAPAVSKKKKFSKGISLQEFNRVISTPGIVASSPSPAKAPTTSVKSSPWSKPVIPQCISAPSVIDSPMVTETSLQTPTKAAFWPPDTASPSEIEGVNPRKAFALADFLPGSARKGSASAAAATTPAQPVAVSKAAWGSPASAPIPTVQQGPLSSSRATSKPLPPSAPLPVSFYDLQRAEEAARQRSNITSLQGNSIPWYVERRPRAESLEHVIRQQARDREEEEEHQRLRNLYLPAPEPQPAAKASSATPIKKKDASKKTDKRNATSKNEGSKGPNNGSVSAVNKGGDSKRTPNQKPTR